MEPKKGMPGFSGKRSLFFSTLASLMAMSLITVIVFGILINQLVVKNQKSNIDDLNLHQLQRISSDVELVFDLLSQGMTRSMWSDDFINLMIAPNQHNADLAFRVIQVLEDQVEENDLVRKSYLYLPFTDKVYVYSGTYTELDYLGDRDMVYRYLDIREDNRDPDATSEWRILMHNRRIFLATDFCLPNFVGAMFYEINRTELYDIIQAENEKFDTTIYVCDENGGLLFDYMAAGPQPEDFSRPENFLTLDYESDSANYYMYTSEKLGWKYLVRIDPGDTTVPAAVTLGILLPGLAFYIMISQLFSVYITQRIYKPINRLLQITTNPKGLSARSDKTRRRQDEIDFLELAWQDSLDKNEQHQELMESISDDIMEQLLRGILTGKGKSQKEILSTLEGIGRPDWNHGHFVVLAAELSYEKNEEITPIQQELYQRSLLRTLSQLHLDTESLTALPIGQNHVIVVLRFPKEISAFQIRERARQLIQLAENETKPFPYHLLFGTGKIHDELTSIQFSYHEAMENIHYSHYMKETAAEERSKITTPEQRYYRERAHHAYSLAENSCLAEASEELSCMLDEILERESRWEACLQDLVDDMLEKLISCRVTQAEMKAAGISGNVDLSHRLNTHQSPKSAMQEFYQKALVLIWDSSRKSHNRYVEDAKEYIASHYAEGTLALNEISEAVGISSSYLSNIFAECTGIGLNAYLNEYRIQQAKRFLNETNLNISEIGYKCGFNSAQSFTRVFKKNTGMTPKQFRDLPSSAK